MIKVSLQQNYCLIEPQGPLAREDFVEIAAHIDPLIASGQQLGGLVIRTRKFPGWQGLDGLIGHLRFVRNHHRAINRVALVTDAAIAQVVPALARHFVQAQVRQFEFDDFDAALAWVQAPVDGG